ncbi:MAG: response regulator transcription factor, partial [Chthoniobacterales bacterium]
RRARIPAATRAEAIRSVFESNPRAVLKLGAATDAGQFWAAAQALLAQGAPSSMRWLCLRPVRMATAMMFLQETAPSADGSSSRKTKALMPDVAETALLRELFARHPAIVYFRHHAGLPLVHHLGAGEAALTGENWSRWPGLSKAKFCTALAFWKRKKIQGVLLLHRAQTEGDFAEAEIAVLRELQPHLETALCRVIERRRQDAQKQLLAGVFKPLPLPLVLCDWQMKVICESAAGLEARAGWELGEEERRVLNVSGRRALASDLAEHCRARIKTWEKAAPDARAALEKEEHEIAHPHRPDLGAVLSMVRHRSFPLVEPFFLFHFKAQAPHAPTAAALPRPSRHPVSFAPLSAREREVARLVCDGHGNAFISRQLGKSVHTVKSQVSSIFQKLQVTSRSGLLALVARVSVQLLCLYFSDLLDPLGDFFSA